jgi:uncharacterized protein (TIGR00730 family)
MAVKNICVFCGASPDVSQKYKDVAAKCGEYIGKKGYHLVYGGGSKGMLNIVAHATSIAGGRVIGVYPSEALDNVEEEMNQNMDETIVVDSLFERKKRMIERGDIFVVLPGGYGTIDELFEVVNIRKLCLNSKPIFIVNTQGFWDPVLEMMDRVMEEKFCACRDEKVWVTVDDVAQIFSHAEFKNDDVKDNVKKRKCGCKKKTKESE